MRWITQALCFSWRTHCDWRRAVSSRWWRRRWAQLARKAVALCRGWRGRQSPPSRTRLCSTTSTQLTRMTGKHAQTILYGIWKSPDTMTIEVSKISLLQEQHFHGVVVGGALRVSVIWTQDAITVKVIRFATVNVLVKTVPIFFIFLPQLIKQCQSTNL